MKELLKTNKTVRIIVVILAIALIYAVIVFSYLYYAYAILIFLLLVDIIGLIVLGYFTKFFGKWLYKQISDWAKK